jgi:CubicO group peptidase (beta-lactamase class C family)
MTSSGYLYRDGMARPHDENGKMMGDRKATAFEVTRYGAAGGLHSSAEEYAKFLIEVIDPKPSDQYRQNASTLQEMTRAQVKVSDSLSWGLGWGIQHTEAGDVIYHGGDNPGYEAMVAAFPRRKSAFVILTNGDQGYDKIIKPLVASEAIQRFVPLKL